MSDARAEAAFEKFYNDEYGLQKFFGPLALFFIVVVVETSFLPIRSALSFWRKPM